MRVKSEGSRVCLWGIFQSGGSEDVMKLLEDWWSESRRGCTAPCSPGGAEPRRMAPRGGVQGIAEGMKQLAGRDCQEEYRERNVDA